MMTIFHYISLPEWIWWYANIIDLIDTYLVDFPCTSASDQISVTDNSTGTAHLGRKKRTPLMPALILRVIWMVLMHYVWKPGPAKRTEWLSWLIMYPRLSERMRWLSVSGSFTIIYLLVQLGVVHRKGHSLALFIVELKGKNCVGFAGLFNLCLVRLGVLYGKLFLLIACFTKVCRATQSADSWDFWQAWQPDRWSYGSLHRAVATLNWWGGMDFVVPRAWKCIKNVISLGRCFEGFCWWDLLMILCNE